MKTLNAVIKVLTALAAVAGVVYIVATYGEQIVAWAKKMLNALPKCPNCDCNCEVVEEAAEEAEVETPAEEVEAAPEAAAEEVAEEVLAEEPAPEIVVAEHEPVAEEADFAE